METHGEDGTLNLTWEIGTRSAPPNALHLQLSQLLGET